VAEQGRPWADAKQGWTAGRAAGAATADATAEEQRREEGRIRGNLVISDGRARLPATSQNCCHVIAIPLWFWLRGVFCTVWLVQGYEIPGFVVQGSKSEDRNSSGSKNGHYPIGLG